MKQGNQIQNFNFNGSSVRVLEDESGHIYFVAKDVCDVLGYSNSRKAIEDNCKKDGVTTGYITDSLGREQQMIILNEGNIYRLAIKSKKKESERFETWVCDEVLPTIRKTGSYMSTLPSVPQTFAEALRLAADTLEKNERLQLENAELKPKAEYTDKVLLSVEDMTTTTIAKELGMSAKALNKLLLEKRIQFYHDKHYVLYQKYVDKGYANNRTYQWFDNEGKSHTRSYLVWTEAGRMFIHSLF